LSPSTAKHTSKRIGKQIQVLEKKAMKLLSDGPSKNSRQGRKWLVFSKWEHPKSMLTLILWKEDSSWDFNGN
jgi:hypothetical protein